MSISITLPDIDVEELGKTEPEIRLDLAVFLYLVWNLPAGRCAAYAGVPKVIFLDELGKRGIPVNYDLEKANFRLAQPVYEKLIELAGEKG